MDWETAGWGVPAMDLAQLKGALSPDIETYAAAVRSCWPSLNTRDLERLARFGTMFRLIFSIASESENLRYDWVDDVIDHLSYLQTSLTEWIREAGWQTEPYMDKISIASGHRG